MTETRVPLFLSVDILVTLFALAFVALRVGYRHAKHALTLSDYMICCAMVRNRIALCGFALEDMLLTGNSGHRIDPYDPRYHQYACCPCFVNL